MSLSITFPKGGRRDRRRGEKGCSKGLALPFKGVLGPIFGVSNRRRLGSLPIFRIPKGFENRLRVFLFEKLVLMIPFCLFDSREIAISGLEERGSLLRVLSILDLSLESKYLFSEPF